MLHLDHDLFFTNSFEFVSRQLSQYLTLCFQVLTFIPSFVFLDKFCTEGDLVLPLSVSSILSLP
jgi:hypothetical protein